jgi:hypothetical protein
VDGDRWVFTTTSKYCGSAWMSKFKQQKIIWEVRRFQHFCIMFCGPIANTESWDGSSWTEVADLALARGYLASAGSATSALASGGEAPGSPYYRANTEEWTAAAFEVKTLTTS